MLEKKEKRAMIFSAVFFTKARNRKKTIRSLFLILSKITYNIINYICYLHNNLKRWQILYGTTLILEKLYFKEYMSKTMKIFCLIWTYRLSIIIMPSIINKWDNSNKTKLTIRESVIGGKTDKLFLFFTGS